MFRANTAAGIVFAAAALVIPAQSSEPMLGNSVAGKKLLLSAGCGSCHRLQGKASERGTDLDRAVARDYSVTGFVTVLWNHDSPAVRPHFTETDVRDLLAYALSRRYFEMPGDAARGKTVFVGKGCANCHGISAAAESGAPPVTAWTSLSDPVAFAADLWDHAPQMIEAQRKRGVRWGELSSQEATDLLVYLRGLPEVRHSKVQSLAETASQSVDGQRLFQLKHCSICHTSGWQLHRSSGRITPAGFAGSMWNHRLDTAKEADYLDRQEMRALFSYLWSVGALDDRASARRGERLFMSKGCSACHGDGSSARAGSETPRLRLGEMDRMAAVTALLNHEPAMLDRTRSRGIPWPQFRPGQMQDLIAFLTGGGAR